MYANAYSQTFNAGEFIKSSSGLSDNVLSKRVVAGLSDGWSSGFRGSSFEFLDRSSALEPNAERVLLDTLIKYRSKGYALGPFKDRPPFPTPQHPDVQPLVHTAFTVPKERWEKDSKSGPQRMIVHGSTPTYSSFNDQTPRADSGYPYHTGEMFFSKVAKGGRGSLVMLIDGVDWYMQFALPEREWGRQCLKVGGEFWVIIAGMFGSVYAGDNANCMAQFLCNVGREEYGLKGLDFYVDNFENVVPGLPNGEPDWERAESEWKDLNALMDRFGVRCHHRAPPARMITTVPGTDVASHLGWCCDLQKQTAIVPEKTRPVIKRLVAEWASLKKFSLDDLESICGFFLFLSLVLKS